MGSEASKTRRSFLSLLGALGSVAIGALIAVPGASYVLDPLLRGAAKKGRWLRVARFDSIDADDPTAVAVVGEQVDAWTREPNVRLGMVWLRKKGDQVMALTAECPHLGCKVGYDKDHKRFGCPCHESAFSVEGDKIGGPAPRGMDPLEARIVNGQVEVRFVRFRAQVKEREEVA